MQSPNLPDGILSETIATVTEILGADLDAIAVERAVIGLFFTGVKLTTGHAGACATPIKTIPEAVCCPSSAMAMPFPGKMKGKPARDAMKEVFSDHGIRRGVGIATVNALAELCWERRPHPQVELLRGLDAFDANTFRPDDQTVVVGAFVPFLKELKRRGQPFLVLEKDPDTLKASEMPFYRPAETAREVVPQADVLLMTGTTLLNDTLAICCPGRSPRRGSRWSGRRSACCPTRSSRVAPTSWAASKSRSPTCSSTCSPRAAPGIISSVASRKRLFWRDAGWVQRRRRPSKEYREDAMAAVRLGSGDYTFEVDEDWAKIPDEITLGDCAAVGVDSKDNVYAFNRGDHPVAVFDKDGNFLRSWGEGLFPRPHGVHVAPDDTIWLTDDADHTVRHCTLDGKVLLALGVPGKPSPYMSGEPFHRCTHTALSPQGDFLYISDGYGNARVHKYTPSGKLLSSWGEPGTDPGQFNIPHNICCDPDGWLYVADRENHRVQIFNGDGKWETQWNYLHRPNGMCLGHGSHPLCYIGEGGPSGEINREWPNIGPRVSIHTTKNHEVMARLGKTPGGMFAGGFTSPHGIAVDSQGNIYVGELSGRSWSRFAKGDAPKKRRVIHKLVRVLA
jgi:uncharacterized protein (DUF4213/DUF364 family)/DNA-binding beta-propeller fold protein YncE